ncbi:MAG: class I SAM-dependent methyltransferase [Acidobacteriota bacterium]
MDVHHSSVDAAEALVERVCPVCESPDRDPQSVEGVFSLVRCRACGMIYTHRVRSVEAKTLFYQRLAEERQDTTSHLNPAHYGLANQIKSCRLYDRVLMQIREWCPRGDVHLVDVGCAGGLFLLAAQVADDGYNVGAPPRFKVRGVSIDPREQHDTERNVGCPVEAPARAAAAWPAWADVVTALNTLEHVNEPRPLLACIRQMLRPGGRVIIDVPNNYVLVRRAVLQRRWPSLDIGEHINHFVPGTLDRLMTAMGFTPAERLPGLLRGVESLGRKPGVSQIARWSVARAVMTMTGGAIHAFPHMTMAYRRED